MLYIRTLSRYYHQEENLCATLRERDGDDLVKEREHKEPEGINGAPGEHFLNILSCDHDCTLYIFRDKTIGMIVT